jgi:hypothetical protein
MTLLLSQPLNGGIHCWMGQRNWTKALSNKLLTVLESSGAAMKSPLFIGQSRSQKHAYGVMNRICLPSKSPIRREFSTIHLKGFDRATKRISF